MWTPEFRPDFTVAESGIAAFVAFDKDVDFIGKAAALRERQTGVEKKLVTLIVDSEDVDCVYDEAVFHIGKCVGYVTSGEYAHYCQQSMAMAYLPTALAIVGEQFEVEILGELKAAFVQAKALHDPTGSRMKV